MSNRRPNATSRPRNAGSVKSNRYNWSSDAVDKEKAADSVDVEKVKEAMSTPE